MGLLDMMLPGTNTTAWASPLGLPPVVQPNPFASWFDQNQQKIVGGLAGLAGASPNDPRGILSGIVGGVMQGGPADQAKQQAMLEQAKAAKDAATKQAEQAQTIAWLKQNAPQYAGLPAATGIDLYKSDRTQNGGADPSELAIYKFYANDEMKAGRAPKGFADWEDGRKQAVKAGLGNPLPYRDATGNWHAVEPMSDGTAVDLATGKAPDANLMYDPFGFAGGKAQQTATGTAVGTTLGGQATTLPKAQLQSKQATDLADKVLSNPRGMDEAFGNFVGIPQQVLPAYPGTPKADFLNDVGELISKSWLTVRQDLKGAGQVTDYEGAKAEAAVSQMGAAIKSGSKEAFIQAVKDYKAAVAAGYAIIAQQAQQAGAAAAPLPNSPQSYILPGASGGNTTSTGVQWSIGQ